MFGLIRDRLIQRPGWPRTGARPVVADVEARQGPRGRPVLTVLLGSLVLLGVYLTGMMVWAVVDAPVAPREQTAPREQVAGGPPVVPSSALNVNDPPAANPAYPVPAVPYVK